MKLIFRILCIGALAGVLGFSIVASATDKPYEPLPVADDQNDTLIARNQNLSFTDSRQSDSGKNTPTLNNNLQNSALVIPPNDGQFFPSLKFNEAGNMLLLGVVLIMIAGLGRKVMRKN